MKNPALDTTPEGNLKEQITYFDIIEIRGIRCDLLSNCSLMIFDTTRLLYHLRIYSSYKDSALLKIRILSSHFTLSAGFFLKHFELLRRGFYFLLLFSVIYLNFTKLFIGYSKYSNMSLWG